MLRIKTTRDSSKTSHLIAFLTTCIVLLLPISAFPLPTWVYVDPDMSEGSPPQIEITDHCDDYTKVKVTIPGFWCEDVYEAGEVFQKIWVPVYGTKMEEGKPELPVVRGLLGIPGTNNATDVEVLSATWEQFSDYLVYPHQPDYLISEPPPPFEWDEEFYQQNIWYPGDEALLSNPGMFREIKVVNSHIQCFQYNPAREFLKVASEMEIRVSYGASEGGSGGLQLEGETINGVHKDFEPLYQSLVWNYAYLNCFPTPVACDYLIITGKDYFCALSDLVDLLIDRNYHVDLVKIDEITEIGDPLAVYQYIRDRYETDRIAYVLLVGDVQDSWGSEPFDPHLMVPIPYWLPGEIDDPNPWYRPSDVCYACLNNNDSPPSYTIPPDLLWIRWWTNFDMYPDVYVGRLTADEVHQVWAQVDKIVYYETKADPPPEPGHLWYDNMLFVSHRDREIEYYKGKILNPSNIFYDIPLPPVEFLKGSVPGTTNDDVIDFIELGCNIVNYYGHGSWDDWDNWAITPDPMDYTDFKKDPHVENLNNDHLVVAFNIGCVMAVIDTWRGDSLCDCWLRLPEYDPDPYHGAIATIGATREMYHPISSYFDKALFETMYGVQGDGFAPIEPVNIIGAVHYGALVRVSNILYSGSWTALKIFYPYILLGEPSMEIRNIFTETGGLKIEKSNLLSSEMPLEVTIYPNPSPGIFTLKVQGYSPGLGEVKVYDLSGRLIRKIEFPQLDTAMGGLETGLPEIELSLDLSDLTEGLYLLNVGDEVTERVLILK